MPTTGRGRVLAVGAATLVAVMTAAPAAATVKTAAVRPAPAQTRGTDDVLYTASADAAGYHLFSATARGGWTWQPLATIQPAGYDGEPWTGRFCATGDGRWLVAVVAPWHANNSADGLDRGGFAYAVDARTGAARPLAAGVSLAYFNPGCGSGGEVALTRFDGADQQRTRVAVADPATGATRLVAVADGEITSAVPAMGGVVAADGGTLVRLSPGARTRLATLPGLAFGLHPAADGGIDLLSRDGTDRARAWHYRDGRLTAVATGNVTDLRLYPGRGGHNILAGATSVIAAGAVRILDVGDSVPQQVSPTGAAAVEPAPAEPVTAPATGAIRRVPADRLPVGGGPITTALPGTTAVSTPSGVAPAAAPTDPWQSAPARYQSPRCAIPRNKLAYQVMQPGFDQIVWAADQAVNGGLTAQRTGYPDGLPGYQPSTDFPKPALLGNPGVSIPVNLIWGIMAQESNWDQASWHVPRGGAGNPLTADYYGSGGATSGLDFDAADCGYGLGQLTTIMRLPSPGAAPTLQQQAVAVDYAENVAATVAALGATWNTLYSKNIRLNDSNARFIENWYTAIWAYNSGLQPTGPAYGNVTGCDPGPTCTDGPDGDNPGGNWGLGFANNPANPAYNPQRKPFLRVSYDDATHPADWPYQEKVFGWAESPERSGNTWYYPALPGYLTLPSWGTFCVAAVNHCTFNSSTHQGTCAYSDYHCWWHASATFVSCTAVNCQQGGDPHPPGSAEPAYPANPFPGICDLGSTVTSTLTDPQNLPTADTTVVDDERVGGNGSLRAISCGASGRNWSLRGTFTPTLFTDPVTGAPNGDVDWHQLTAGFGGHLFFTHTVKLADPADSATWDPGITTTGYYEVRAFVPAVAAATAEANYTITNVVTDPQAGTTGTFHRYVNQAIFADDWADLGFYHLAPGATVSLTARTDDGNATQDIAFDAVAFTHITPGSYVALGDSYSAGEGSNIPIFENSSSIPALGAESANGDSCDRNINAYSRQYALQTTAFAGRAVVHLACSGADIDDVLGAANSNTPKSNPDLAGNAYYGEPYQVAQIPPDAQLVTLSVGGNDAGFIDVLTNCIQLDTIGQGVLRCQPAYTDYTKTPPDDRLADTVTGLGPRLLTVYQAVKAAAPTAHIVVVTYPKIFNYDPSAPDTQVDCSGIGNLDRKWLGHITDLLDDQITKQAHAAGLDVLDERNAFAGHEMCDGSPDVQTVNLFWLYGSFHPTPAGYAQEAADLKAHLAAENIIY